MNFLCEQELQRSAPYEKYIQVPEKKINSTKGG